MSDDPKIYHCQVPICEHCLNGAGGECHSPGCILWINRGPDIALIGNPFLNIVANPNCSHKCDICEDQDHHWLPGMSEDFGEPVMECKHCSMIRFLYPGEETA